MQTSTPYALKESTIKDDGTFEGYASDFKDEPDDGGDIVRKGAFVETIRQGGRNKTGIVMCWQHDYKQLPGIWEKIEEDSHGLFVAGRFALETELGKSAHVLMKMKAIQHLSYGYDAKQYTEDKEREVRYLEKVDLWEISPVTFPMLIRTSISNVKALTDARTERELERALRDSGLSRSEALYIAGLCKSSLRELKSTDPGSLENALKMLQDLNAEMKMNRAFADAHTIISSTQQ